MNGLDKVIEHLNHAHLDALLNPPTDDMILEHLKKEMGHIPADYIEFLKRCNGLTLYHSGDYCLFDAQEILVMPDFQCHLSSIALKFITLLHYT